jgi:2-methylcitrate dehydratase PrpD
MSMQAKRGAAPEGRLALSTISEQFAEFATSETLKRDRSLASRMRIYALDTLAVMLAGSIAPSSAIAARTVLAASGKGEASVLATGRKTSAWDAALVNGAFAHALELDDDHRVAVLHPGAVAAPAALAAAEADNASGLTFLRALFVGYDVMCRLGEVFRGNQFKHGVHPTALCGVFGAAAAAAVAMDLDRDAFVRALGIAGTQAAGLTEWRFDGSWIKRLHPGKAAHSGVLAARLAREGFTGPATIFEGPGGFFNAFSFGEPIDADCAVRNLGVEHSAFGAAIKPYPCCRFAHGAIDLALAAVQSGVSADAIEAVAVRIYATNVLSYHHRPKNTVDAQFNVPYVVAVALAHGRIGLGDFTASSILNPETLALCGRVSVVEDAAFTRRYPDEYPVELKITLKNGETRTAFSDCPSGDPGAARYQGRSDLLDAEVQAKVGALLGETGFGERVDRLRALTSALPDAPDVADLARVLREVPREALIAGSFA